MASGWAKEGAVQEQIDSTVNDALHQARRQLPTGESLFQCEECGADIPEARRQALKGVRLCISCQGDQDRKHSVNSGYNRRGSKDSQLR